MRKTGIAINAALFTCLFILGCSPAAYRAQSDTVVDTIPFQLSPHNNIIVEALLNNTDTLRLMLHTAANSVSIIRDCSERLQSIQWGQETEVSAWGGKGKSRYSGGNLLKVAATVFDSLPVWENDKSGPGTDGKFGLNLFEDYAVAINFDDSLITLHRVLPDTEGYVNMSMENRDGLLFIEGTTRLGATNYTHPFLIHSGYAGSMLFDDQFSSDANLAQHIEITSAEELKDAYGNVVATKKGILPEFSLGDFRFYDLPVGFFEGTIGRQQMSVLGGDFIRRFNVIISKDREVIYLQRNACFAD
ncbi:MAG: hypothetical protein RIC19_18035 [Phaeodactylibacter sp.]|uniref:hypothetical protein n=1 Tax=Phaeodactylibacter sp. TaxID=1940289 RepID=UPI0032EE3ACA